MNRERSVHVVLAAIGTGALLAYLLACRPSWSPDGSKVLFSYRDSKTGPDGGPYGLAFYDRNSGRTRSVFAAPDGAICWGQWRRSGEEVVAAWTKNPNEGPLNVAVVGLDSPKPLRTFVLGDVRGAEDSLPGFPFPEVGGRLFIGARRVIRLDLETGEIKRSEVGEKAICLVGHGDDIHYFLGELRPEQAGEIEIGTLDPKGLSLKPMIQLRTEQVGSLWFSLCAVARDGSALAIPTKKGKQYEVVIVAGGKLKQQVSLGLSSDANVLGNLQWSHDGKTVYAAVTSEQKRQLSIAELSLDTGALRLVSLARLGAGRLDIAVYDFQIGLSPDGKTLAAAPTSLPMADSRDRALHLVDLTDPERKITRVPLPPPSAKNP